MASPDKKPPPPTPAKLRLGLFRPEMTDEEIQAVLDEMLKPKARPAD